MLGDHPIIIDIQKQKHYAQICEALADHRF